MESAFEFQIRRRVLNVLFCHFGKAVYIVVPAPIVADSAPSDVLSIYLH